jgi:DME family drug/metabolite transporter
VKHKLTGPLLILCATLLWGTTGTTQALAPDGATPLSIGALRIIVAAAALLVLALGAGRLREISGLRRPATLLAALGVALYQPFFFLGVDRTGVVVGTIVAIGTAPVVGGLLAWAYDRAPPTRTWLAATGVAVVGVTMLVTAGADIGADAAGVVFAAMAGSAYATYVIAARQFSRAGDVVGATAVIFAIAAVLLMPLLAVDSPAWVATPGGTATVLYLGLLATAAAYLLFAKGLETTRSTTATTLTLGEPVTAALLGVIVVGERPPPLGWIGFALVLGALTAVAGEGRSHRILLRRHTDDRQV